MNPNRNSRFAAVAEKLGRLLCSKRFLALPGACLTFLLCANLGAQSRLLAPTENAAELAYSLALDGQRVAAGAPGAASARGLVYAYNCAGQSCSPAVSIPAGDLDSGDLYGSAVSLSGDTLAIGAPGQDGGAVYVYVHDGFGWLLQQKLGAIPALADERLGTSLALDGDRLAVGAPGASDGAGAVYIFERSVSWNQTARLQASDAATGNFMGSSIALSGNTVLTGAPQRASMQIGAYSQGAAYVFEYSAPNWTQQARLLPPLISNGQLFGHAVSLWGNRAVIGAPLADLRIGSAFVFERVGSIWSQQAQLAAPGGLPGDRFGWSVAIDDAQLMVGAPFSLAGCGESHRFALIGGIWTATPGPAIARPTPGGLAGWSVATQAQRWLVGVPGHSGAPSHVGAAYLLDASDGLFSDGFENSAAVVCALP